MLLPAGLDVLGEQVGHGRQPGVRVGVQGVDGRAASPRAAAHQAHLEHVAARGMGAAGDRQGGGRRCHCAGFQKRAA